MRGRMIGGLGLVCAMAGTPAAAQDMLAGWSCAAGDGASRAVLEYDAHRRLELEHSAVVWDTPGGPLGVGFSLPVTGPDRFAATPDRFRARFDPPKGAPEPKWLEITADGKPLFSGPLAGRIHGAAGLEFRASAKGQAQIVAGAWSAKRLRVRFLDAGRRPLGQATAFLPPLETRSAPLSAAFARAQGRFGDAKVCSARAQAH
ncbi:hypothetical protein [Caulobacter sp. 17J80-11]|uniref:hypothetical protein n=1 Tax=Caulobacter sp. 17J80-11 TaxID=2763502 RepID=UPI00165341F0|nr:hypothetical protein [Caulobacter sp. 17J80-11]MBC6982062.1 hypothetical protein [Caulobacter sp. 17J80-11]